MGFALELLELHLFANRDRRRLHLSRREVWSLSLFLGVGILAGGRAVEIAFDEWPFYQAHPQLIPAFWCRMRRRLLRNGWRSPSCWRAA